MCMVSAVFDYGKNIPPTQWTWPGIVDYEKLVEAAKKFDADNGEPDCEDPTKAEFMKELKKIKKRLKKIEKAQKKRKSDYTKEVLRSIGD